MAYFAISCDDVETNTKFARSLDLDYPILSDPGREVARAYGVVTPERGYPHRWTFYIGAEGRILFVDRNVNPSSAGDDVVARLRELGISKR